MRLSFTHCGTRKKLPYFRLAVFFQLGASLSISVIYKFAYIAQFISLNCELKIIQLKIANVILLILYSSCIVLQVIVYRRPREILGNYGRRAEMTKTPISNNFPVIIFNLISQQVILSRSRKWGSHKYCSRGHFRENYRKADPL